ncbi:MAG: tyrosinase family protein [Pseudonocardiaceae bacterium]
MSTNSSPRVRRSIQDLQNDYTSGAKKKPLEDLIRAWRGIKDLPSTNPKSFFVLGGLHGEPFRGAGWGNGSYWGGYCNHGNVLFPIWHRVHLLMLEEALQSIEGCQDAMLPYWDETSADSLRYGIPSVLTWENFELDGRNDNPLQSYRFDQAIQDFINGDKQNYSKHAGYETVRYPLAGLVGTPEDREATKKHNEKYSDYNKNVEILNDNVKNWLTSTIEVEGEVISTNVNDKYFNCLNAPNYTVFSNTTSAAQWNVNLNPGKVAVVSLEQPHNDIHLAVGGFQIPNANLNVPLISASGDMGENDTAGFDPIFYFHHCFVDRMFWLWQNLHNSTRELDIIPEYPGTNSVDSQGPTPGVAPNSWLTLDSPINPFINKKTGTTYTSRDCIDIENRLGYTYDHGSLEEYARPTAASASKEEPRTKTIRVTGINRAAIRGSFLVSAFANIDGKRYHVGTESVLSRWSVQGCANCQTHLEMKAFIGLRSILAESLTDSSYEVEIRTHNVPDPYQNPALSTSQENPFHFEVY